MAKEKVPDYYTVFTNSGTGNNLEIWSFQFISFIYSDETKENPFQFKSHFPRQTETFPFLIEKILTELKVWFFDYLLDSAPSTCLNFLDFHYSKFNERYPGRGIDFMYFLEGNIIHIKKTKVIATQTNEEKTINQPLPQTRKKLILEWIETKRKELPADEPQTVQAKKIKWNGNPALFGWLFRELVDKGYFDPPKYGSEESYAGFAKLCYDHFQIESKPGKQTTLENLIKEMNPKKQTLSLSTKAKFTIRPLSEIA